MAGTVSPSLSCRCRSTPSGMARSLLHLAISRSDHPDRPPRGLVKRKSNLCLPALAEEEVGGGGGGGGEDCRTDVRSCYHPHLHKCNTIATLSSSPPRLDVGGSPVPDGWGQFVDMDSELYHRYDCEPRPRREKGRKRPLAFSPCRAA